MKRLFGSMFGVSVRAALHSRWPRLYRVAYSWCHDPQLADDLVQETAARALRSREHMPNAKALEVWLFQIMRNCWRDHLRRLKPTVDVDAMNLQSDSDPERIHYNAQVSARVRAAVASLNDDQRQIFTLVVVDGMSYDAVAQVLEIPIGTVMSRLWRARQQLQEQLRDLAPQPNSPAAKLWSVK